MKPVTITMPEDLLERIDSLALKEERSRSNMLVVLANIGILEFPPGEDEPILDKLT